MRPLIAWAPRATAATADCCSARVDMEPTAAPAELLDCSATVAPAGMRSQDQGSPEAPVAGVDCCSVPVGPAVSAQAPRRPVRPEQVDGAATRDCLSATAAQVAWAGPACRRNGSQPDHPHRHRCGRRERRFRKRSQRCRWRRRLRHRRRGRSEWRGWRRHRRWQRLRGPGGFTGNAYGGNAGGRWRWRLRWWDRWCWRKHRQRQRSRPVWDRTRW